jgi:hypothetical protein
MGAADITGAVVTSPVKLVQAIRSTGSPTQVIDATAQSVIDPAIESQQVTNAAAAASPDVSWLELIPEPLRGAFFFFVVIPVFAVLIFVTSAVNVVLGALGLPLLPNVPDLPFGPTPQLNAATAPTVDTNRVLSDPVVPQMNKTASLTGSVETNRVLSDPVVRNTDTANTSKPVMNVAKDSPVFTPKPRGRDSSSPDSDLDRTPVETTADDASTAEQHPVGRVGKKPKPDAANEEQKPGHDPSATRSLSQ